MNLLYCQRGMLCPYFSGIGLLLLLCHGLPVLAQENFTLQGRVVSGKDGEPLPGASVYLRGTQQGTTTNEQGMFTFSVPGSRVELSISFIGYIAADTLLYLPLTNGLVVILREDAAQLEEIAVTGYQTIPKERATGSFVHLDNELLNRRVSTNILDRLDGVAGGVFLSGAPSNVNSGSPLDRQLNIRIRGESTLALPTQVSRDPLIVIDNFPFEGTLDNINPNDIESITILRDAAAASIWGARAGNGVIVITTKKGRKDNPVSVEINSNITITQKPDIYQDRNYLTAEHYIEAEKILFDAGYFNADLSNTTSRPPLSPVVELLARKRSGAISETEYEAAIAKLSSADIRGDYMRHVYRDALNQQYSVGLKGGGNQTTYSVSAGFDRNLSNVAGNGFNRFTLNSNTSYTLLKNLELTTGINYSNSKTTTGNNHNNFGYLPVGGRYSNIFPYAALADVNGIPLSTARGYREDYIAQTESLGFLDWRYRPLQETSLADRYSKTNSLLLRVGLKYSFKQFLNFEVLYQNEKQMIHDWDYRSESTYYARNLINRFAIRKEDGTFTYQLPRGGILMQNNTNWNSDNLRAQLNFDKSFGADHRLTALTGAEARQLLTESYYRTSYGYDNELGVAVNSLNFSTILPVNPESIDLLSPPPGDIIGFNNRFISYYANAAYTFRSRYTLSGSARRDGANIFGANTNNRFTPLWSAGMSWDLSRESFYKLRWLPYLKLRSSFGYSGNVYQGSIYTTGVYLTNGRTGARYIHNLTAPNPELRWEQIGTFNTGIDFSLKNNLLSGSIEYYSKSGRDLIELQPLAPSAGFNQFYTNGAATQTQGIDLNLTARIVKRGLTWSPVFLLSSVNDKITQFSVRQTAGSIRSATGRPGIVGRPLYSVYSYRWAGLDPVTGDPQGYLNGEISKNYTGILNNFNPDSLAFHGSSVPTIFGAFRNDISFRGFSFSVNLVYKLGYYFRRQAASPNYQDVLSDFVHQDYVRRWQQPGDNTDIPSFVYPANSNRTTFYRFSEVLVEKGDHIRLQDIRLSYDLPSRVAGRAGFRSVRLYAYVSNLGIIWKANRLGIDPDTQATSHVLPRPVSAALGLKLNF